jgi:hypothetical protein
MRSVQRDAKLLGDLTVAVVAVAAIGVVVGTTVSIANSSQGRPSSIILGLMGLFA